MEGLEQQKKALAYAIAEYLTNELGGVEDEVKESMEGKSRFDHHLLPSRHVHLYVESAILHCSGWDNLLSCSGTSHAKPKGQAKDGFFGPLFFLTTKANVPHCRCAVENAQFYQCVCYLLPPPSFGMLVVWCGLSPTTVAHCSCDSVFGIRVRV